MRLRRFEPCPQWQSEFENAGFLYHSFDGSYWIDEIGLELSAAEYAACAKACLEVRSLALDLAADIVQKGDYARLRLNDRLARLAERSWRQGAGTLYGRFDLTFQDGTPKIYEYNADTPTSILEAGVAQPLWSSRRGVECAASLDRLMPEAFRLYAEKHKLDSIAVTGCAESLEDTCNLMPLVRWAKAAGLSADFYPIEELMYFPRQRLHGFGGVPFEAIFKLYPWESFTGAAYEHSPFLDDSDTLFSEPAWKILLSSKAFLALAWEKEPGHPNLLPAFFAGDPAAAELMASGNYARKPLYSREGSNVTVCAGNGLSQSLPGPYGKEGHIVQQFCPMPEPEPGMRFTLGGWICGERFGGVCARFTDSLIVTNTSQACAAFVGP